MYHLQYKKHKHRISLVQFCAHSAKKCLTGPYPFAPKIRRITAEVWYCIYIMGGAAATDSNGNCRTTFE